MVGCYVFGCNHRTGGVAGCSFRRFPANEAKRRLWTHVLRRFDRKPNPNSRVCSCHFPLGKNIPTIVLPESRLPHPQEPIGLSQRILGIIALPPNPRENRKTTLAQKAASADGQRSECVEGKTIGPLVDKNTVFLESEEASQVAMLAKVDRSGKSAKMDQGHSVGTRSTIEKDGVNARVSEAAHVNRETASTKLKLSTLSDFKKLLVSSKTGGCYLQCPLCYYKCNTKSALQIHIGSQHPLYCDDMAVGRLGKIVFYQRTAKLFHCHVCFFTSKDYVKMFDHLLVMHCCPAKAADEAKGTKPKSGDAKDDRGASKSGRDIRRKGTGQDETTHESQAGEASSTHGALKTDAGAMSSSSENANFPAGALKRKRTSVSCSEEEDEEEDNEDELASSQAAKEENDAIFAEYVEHLTPRYFYCKVCKWRCKKKGFMLNHVSEQHVRHKPHACKECGRAFLLELVLTRHMNRCHKQGLYQCLYCPFKSNFLRGIRRHLSRCRVEEEDTSENE